MWLTNVVGQWGFSGDATRALPRFVPLPSDKVVTSLASAMGCILGEEAHGMGAEEDWGDGRVVARPVHGVGSETQN